MADKTNNTWDRNAGDKNTGNWNTGDRNTGNLNTDTPPAYIEVTLQEIADKMGIDVEQLRIKE